MKIQRYSIAKVLVGSFLFLSMVACNGLQFSVSSVSPEEATATIVGKLDPNIAPGEVVIDVAPTAVPPSETMPTPTPVVPTPDPSTNTTQTVDALVTLLNTNNYEDLRPMIAEPFTIGYWQSQGVTLSPDEAIQQISGMLADSPDLTYTVNREEFPDLLGMQIEQVWPPGVPVTQYVYIIGLGQSYSGQAIIGIRWEQDGRLTWVNMLWAPSGFDALAQGPQPYPPPGELVTDWDTLLDADVRNIGNWETYERVLENPSTGQSWNLTFDYPSDWQIVEKYSSESFLIVQNIVDPPLDHGIPQVPIAKIDLLALVDVEPMYDPNFAGVEGTSEDAFKTVLLSGQPGILHHYQSSSTDGSITTEFAGVFVKIDGQWFIFSGYITVPGSDPGTLEFLTQRVLHLISSVEISG